jgi:hypothetical protein
MKTLVLTAIAALSIGASGIAAEDKAESNGISVKRSSIQRVEFDTSDVSLNLIIDGKRWTYRPPTPIARTVVNPGGTVTGDLGRRERALGECIQLQKAIQSVDEIVIYPKPSNSKEEGQIDRLVLVTRPGQNKS